MNFSPDKTYRRFLLGVASEEEQRGVEEAVLAGELDTLTLQIAEDELVDDYLLGSLTLEERHRFEVQFLITEDRRQKLRLAYALIKYSQKASSEIYSVKPNVAAHGGIRLLLSWKHAAFWGAAASLVLSVLVGLQLMKLHDQAQVAQETRSQMARLEATLAAYSRRTVQVVEPSTGTTSVTTAAVEQMPMIEFGTATRSGNQMAGFRIPAGARYVRIDWKLSPPLAEKYCEVLISNRKQLWSLEFPAEVFSLSKRSTIILPASILTPGMIYHLRLESGPANGQCEELTDSTFQVNRY